MLWFLILIIQWRYAIRSQNVINPHYDTLGDTFDSIVFERQGTFIDVVVIVYMSFLPTGLSSISTMLFVFWISLQKVIPIWIRIFIFTRPLW